MTSKPPVGDSREDLPFREFLDGLRLDGRVAVQCGHHVDIDTEIRAECVGMRAMRGSNGASMCAASAIRGCE
jgi:hypothetical protein